MEQGVDLTVSTRHYNMLVKEGKTDKAAAFRSIQTCALWSPARMEEAGIPYEPEADGHKCPLCGAHNVDEGHPFLGMSQGEAEQRCCHPENKKVLFGRP